MDMRRVKSGCIIWAALFLGFIIMLHVLGVPSNVLAGVAFVLSAIVAWGLAWGWEVLQKKASEQLLKAEEEEGVARYGDRPPEPIDFLREVDLYTARLPWHSRLNAWALHASLRQRHPGAWEKLTALWANPSSLVRDCWESAREELLDRKNELATRCPGCELAGRVEESPVTIRHRCPGCAGTGQRQYLNGHSLYLRVHEGILDAEPRYEDACNVCGGSGTHQEQYDAWHMCHVCEGEHVVLSKGKLEDAKKEAVEKAINDYRKLLDSLGQEGMATEGTSPTLAEDTEKPGRKRANGEAIIKAFKGLIRSTAEPQGDWARYDPMDVCHRLGDCLQVIEVTEPFRELRSARSRTEQFVSQKAADNRWLEKMVRRWLDNPYWELAFKERNALPCGPGGIIDLCRAQSPRRSRDWKRYLGYLDRARSRELENRRSLQATFEPEPEATREVEESLRLIAQTRACVELDIQLPVYLDKMPEEGRIGVGTLDDLKTKAEGVLAAAWRCFWIYADAKLDRAPAFASLCDDLAYDYRLDYVVQHAVRLPAEEMLMLDPARLAILLGTYEAQCEAFRRCKTLELAGISTISQLAKRGADGLAKNETIKKVGISGLELERWCSLAEKAMENASHARLTDARSEWEERAKAT